MTEEKRILLQKFLNERLGEKEQKKFIGFLATDEEFRRTLIRLFEKEDLISFLEDLDQEEPDHK